MIADVTEAPGKGLAEELDERALFTQTDVNDVGSVLALI